MGQEVIPSWSQIFHRLLTMWRLRKFEPRICQECGMPLLPEEGQPGVRHGRCDDCHELLWEMPVRESARKAHLVQGNFTQVLAPGLVTLAQQGLSDARQQQIAAAYYREQQREGMEHAYQVQQAAMTKQQKLQEGIADLAKLIGRGLSHK